MTTKASKFYTRIVSLLMCMMLIACTMPVHAAAASQFDFSAEDTLDKYDTYTKEIADGSSDNSSLLLGTEYVYAAMYNEVNTSRPKPVGSLRYSAFLRSADEKQSYVFYNLKNRTINKNMPSSVLTIYADPGVHFEVRNVNYEPIADQDGIKNKAMVTYFRQSSDNGHNVFYMELVGQDTGKSSTSVTFSAPQSTEPVHYSFWFGAPLLVSGSTSQSKVVLFANKGNTSSNTFSIPFYIPGGIPERTWIKSVTVQKKSFESPNNCSSIDLSLRFPGDRSATSKSIRSSNTVTFEADVNSTLSSKLADGNYVFQLTNIRWLSKPISSYINFEGRATLNYFQPFGY